ncbi:MAG: hypothetical protein Q8T09_16450 [Candidatus Melainabacteria bacterium]|nr:hypothetical protein [Candidatus Melainabacteria bacterium]
MISFQKLVTPLVRFFSRNQANGSDHYELPSPDGESANPWQSNLDRLAERSPEHNDPISSSTEIEEQFQVLMEQAKIEKIKLEAAQNFSRGEKRKADATVTDAKAWWGQSVATWEPLDGKNVDNLEQRRHPRQSKWFHS